jgi:hypothetical protein
MTTPFNYPPLDSIPPWLRATYHMVSHAFPQGMSDQQLAVVMKILGPSMSMRALATLATYVTGNRRSYVEYLDMVYGLGSLSLPEEVTQFVLDQLRLHGYDQWLESDNSTAFADEDK